MPDPQKPPNNCTSQISRNLSKEEIALRGNTYPRPVETASGKRAKAIEHAHMMGIIEWENPNYLRISDENDKIDAECKRGECQLYGKARWRQIARNLNLTYEEVAYQLRK